MDAYLLTAEQALAELKSGRRGLSQAEAAKRLAKHGPNELVEKKPASLASRFVSQFKSVLIIILLAATAISAALGDLLDAAVIFAIVLLNAAIGLLQEERAERAMAALKKIAAPQARAIRAGEEVRLRAAELVPGDIVLLEMGDSVPADCRVLEAFSLKTNEAALTGESTPVGKGVDALKKPVPVADRTNMLFMGTTVGYGRCRALVVSTGMRTELGKIATAIQETGERQTPLQEKLDRTARGLGLAIVAIAAAVFVLGLIRGVEVSLMFLTAVSLAVAAVPEGLPAVITITLAIGLQRMAKRKAIIKKLPAVETLGCTTVICSDKTGTLTLGEMTVRRLYMNGRVITVTGTGYSESGAFYDGNRPVPPSEKHLRMLLKIGAECNNARVEHGQVFGDPTEAALIVAAAKAGVRPSERRTEEVFFTSERKRMSVVSDGTLYTKGAPEVVLKLCNRLYEAGKTRPITEHDRARILAAADKMSSDALRMLAMAYRHVGEREATLERNLIFVGLAGMIDPPHHEAKEAIRLCRRAGIRVVMITGDHRATAVAVARELDMEGCVLTGEELDAMSDRELEKNAGEVAIYARVSPAHKTRILAALRKKGNVVVAMTGDGINDAPAIKEADIGIAMGVTGTDVAKEAADMVLADDNFTTIVAAVEEGRGIYANIKRFINYLLSCNIGEIIVMLAASLAALPLPLLPIQILWMNLITDGLPALALGMARIEKSTMLRPPRNPKESVILRKDVFTMLLVGLALAFFTLYAFNASLEAGETKARTMAFATLVMAQLAAALSFSSEGSFVHGIIGNKFLVFSVAVSVVLQVAIVQWSLLEPVFRTVALSLADWAEVAGLTLGVFIAVEARKLL